MGPTTNKEEGHKDLVISKHVTVMEQQQKAKEVIKHEIALYFTPLTTAIIMIIWFFLLKANGTGANFIALKNNGN